MRLPHRCEVLAMTGKMAGTVRASASVSVYNQRGVSPLQVIVLGLVAEGNCVAVRRGGEQPEAKDQSVGYELDSALVS